MFAAPPMLQAEVVPETEWRTINRFAPERMGYAFDFVQCFASKLIMLASLLLHRSQINRPAKTSAKTEWLVVHPLQVTGTLTTDAPGFGTKRVMLRLIIKQERPFSFRGALSHLRLSSF